MADEAAPNPAPNPVGSNRSVLISWLALVVSGLSLIVSIYGQISASHEAENARMVQAQEIIEKFNEAGKNLPNANNCFEMANLMDPNDLRLVFHDPHQPVAIDKKYQHVIATCLGSPENYPIPTLKDKNLEYFHRTILLKLNSFDVVFTALRTNLGDSDTICRAIWPSFERHVRAFVLRAEEMQPRPDKLQAMKTEYFDTIKATHENPCKSAA